MLPLVISIIAHFGVLLLLLLLLFVFDKVITSAVITVVGERGVDNGQPFLLLLVSRIGIIQKTLTINLSVQQFAELVHTK